MTNEEFMEGKSDAFLGISIDENSSRDYLRGYSRGAKRNLRLMIFFNYVMTLAGIFGSGEMRRLEYENSRLTKEIPAFYQQWGNIPKDCVCPAYLDSRMQDWNRIVGGSA